MRHWTEETALRSLRDHRGWPTFRPGCAVLTDCLSLQTVIFIKLFCVLPSHLNFPFCSQYEMRTEARRKNLLILILHYLTQEGYVITVTYGDAPPLWPFESRDQTLLLEQLCVYRKMSRQYSDSIYTLSPHLFPAILLLLIIMLLLY